MNRTQEVVMRLDNVVCNLGSSEIDTLMVLHHIILLRIGCLIQVWIVGRKRYTLHSCSVFVSPMRLFLHRSLSKILSQEV
jgi:hypothetical protein